jgi:uncharacterized membrane protein
VTSAERVRNDMTDARASALSVWIFDGADQAAATARRLAATPDVTSGAVDDAALVSWDFEAPRPRIRRLAELASEAALGDDFWALVLGLTFRVPLLGAAVAGVAGAASGSLAAAGITESFMNRLRDEVTPGRSALMLLGPQAACAAALEVSTGAERPQTVVATLSPRQISALREVFRP